LRTTWCSRRKSTWSRDGTVEDGAYFSDSINKNLSQADIEQRTGMLRCYTLRVENGHTVPSIETLAKCAQALDIPLYQIFYDGEAEPKKIKGLNLDGEKLSLGERREIESLGRKLTKLKERDKGLVRLLVAKLAQATS
jgi:transcriptional regulator with XRE-family HTH domain